MTEVGPIQVATSGTSDKTYEPDQHAVLESTEAPVVGIGPGTVNTTIQEPIVSSQVTGAHAHNNQDKTWVVEVPSSPQTASENIKISLIENPVEAESQGMKEIDLTNNTEQETIKISFKGHRKKHHQAHNGQHEVLDEESDHKLHGTTNGQEEIKISFVKKKNATAFPITQGNAGIKDIKISFVTKGNRTIAQELPPSEESEPNNENEVTGSPFADQMFNNSTKGRNISVSFVGNKVLQEIPPAQKPIFLPEKGKKSVFRDLSICTRRAKTGKYIQDIIIIFTALKGNHFFFFCTIILRNKKIKGNEHIKTRTALLYQECIFSQLLIVLRANYKMRQRLLIIRSVK